MYTSSSLVRRMLCSSITAVTLVGCATPPLAPQLVLSPESPKTTETLAVQLTTPAEDAERQISHDIAWYVDGAEMTDFAHMAEIAPEHTAKGQEWRVVVTPKDDKDRYGDSVEATVVIVNTAPIAAVEIAPRSPLTTDDLVASASATDADNEQTTYRYRWLKNGAETEHKDSTLSADLTGKDDVWSVHVWAHDGDEEGERAEAQVSVDNAKPVASGVVLSPREAYEDTIFHVEAVGTDDDGDTLTWSYAWFVDSSPVPDADSASLTGASFQKGQTVRVEATPNDGVIDGYSAMSEGVLILNSPPTATGAALTPEPAYESTTLTCAGTGFHDADGDTAQWSYSWRVNRVDLKVSDTTVDGAYFSRGDSVRCIATPFDGEDEGAPQTSDDVIIRNTAPTLASATITPTSPKEGDVLTAAASGAADIDGDKVSYRYSWLVNSKAVGSSRTLSSAFFGKRDSIQVDITPFDGSDLGKPVRSAAVTAVNSAPTMTSVALVPIPAYTTTPITAIPSATDPDGDALTYTYAWYVNGLKQSSTSKTLDSRYFKKDNTVKVTATVSDGDAADSMTSADNTIKNSTPTKASTPAVSPGSPSATDNLVCATSGSTDPDGDALTYFYEWYRNGTRIGTYSTTAKVHTLASSHTAVGQVFYCRVRALDTSKAYGDWSANSGAVTIAGLVKTWSFTDTTRDDVSATALHSFFKTLSPRGTDYIYFEVDGGSYTTNDGAWCATRADWYVSNYIKYSSGSTTLTSGTWNKWTRTIGGSWSSATTTGNRNYFGTGCDGRAYSWCSAWGMGTMYNAVMPGNTTTSGECYARGWSNGRNYKVTIKVGSTRKDACGF